MTKIAVIDKCPNNVDYSRYFNFEFEYFPLSSKKLTKVLKKDVDISIDIAAYDYVILVGSEAVKYYTTHTNVTDHQGTLVDDKFIPMITPGMLHFKPEARPAFERSLELLHKIVAGERTEVVGDFKWTEDYDTARALLLELLEDVKETGLLAIDTETTALYPRDGYVLGVSLAAKVEKGIYVHADTLDDENLAIIQKAIDISTEIYHNAKFDRKMIRYHLGLNLKDKYDDTILLHYLLDETQGTHGLKQLALKYTKLGDYDRGLDEFKKSYCRQHKIKEEDFNYGMIPFEILGEYAAKDAAATLEIYHLFRPKVSQNARLEKVYQELILPASSALEKVEDFGIPVSKDRLEFANKTLTEAIKEASDVFYNSEEVKAFEEIQGKPFNPNSVQQLREFLFTYLGLNPLNKKTSTGAQSTDAEVLEDLEDQHELVRQIIKIRKLGKLKNTYVDKLLYEIDRDGRIRTGFNLISTTSGRLSSSGKFNAQQIPRDDPRIKGAIVAPPGYKIVSQDW